MRCGISSVGHGVCVQAGNPPELCGQRSCPRHAAAEACESPRMRTSAASGTAGFRNPHASWLGKAGLGRHPNTESGTVLPAGSSTARTCGTANASRRSMSSRAIKTRIPVSDQNPTLLRAVVRRAMVSGITRDRTGTPFSRSVTLPRNIPKVLVKQRGSRAHLQEPHSDSLRTLVKAKPL